MNQPYGGAMRVAQPVVHAPLAVTVAAALAAFAPGLCRAQSQPATVTLDTVVVTATSREQPIQDVQASVEVIRPADLRGYAGTSVTEALRQAVGVDARTFGATTSISMRGFLPNGGTPTLILVDGLRRTDKYGITNLNMISLEDVERVEIIRGPMSALYGADAAGGVINVITKRPGGKGGAVSVTLGATGDGQRGTAILGGTARFGDDSLGHRITVESRNQDGFAFEKGARPEDLSGIRHLTLGYAGQLKLGGDSHLRWTLEAVDQDDRRDALLAATPPAASTPYTAYEKERRYFGSLQYVRPVGPGVFDSTLAHGSSDGSTNRSFPNIETTRYDQTQLNLRYFAPVGAHSLAFGAGVVRDSLDVSIDSRIVKRDNLYLLIQDEWRLTPRWKAVLGVRHDHFDDFGNTTNPRASLGWNDGPWTARIGYGTAFRAPTGVEQYSSFTRGRFLILGNPDLKPEESKTFEAAFGWRSAGASFEAIVFSSRVSNLIESVQPGTTQNGLLVSQYQNRSKADLRGVELLGSGAIGGGWSALGSLEMLDATDGNDGSRLVGRARYSLKATARYESGPWRYDIRGRHLNDFWGADPAVRGSAPFSSNYSVADLRVEYGLSKVSTLALGIDNVFNRRTPPNWTSTGSVSDPAARVIYATYRQAF